MTNPDTAARPAPTPADTAGRFRYLAIVVRVSAVIGMVFGAATIAFGPLLMASSGADFGGSVLTDPAFNSQLRYLGAVQAGSGVALWWTTGDLRGRTTLLRILAGTMFVGGLGRVLSSLLFGVGGWTNVVSITIELVLPVAVVVWHWRLLRRN